jgi:hypothetical protein
MKRPDDLICAEKRACAAWVKVVLLLSLLPVFALVAPRVATAQNTAEVCRESKKLYEQDEREGSDLQRMIVIKNADQRWQQSLLELRSAVASNYVVSGLNELASQLTFETLHTVSTKDRLALQRTIRDLLERLIPEVKQIELSELELRIDRNAQRLSTRRKRMKDLRCDDVLAREKSYPDLNGAWESNYKGNWNPTSISQNGQTLSFTNEFNMTSPGEFTSKTTVRATKWENGLGATVSADGNTLTWANGTIWRRPRQ